MTAQEIQRELKRLDVRPQQAAGQNFLLSENIVARMINTAKVTSDDTILEIGPGLGILTSALLATNAKVIAVELEKRFIGHLEKKFAHNKNLRLVTGDVFQINLNDYVHDGQYKLVANLPYSGTALFFRNFLSLAPRPSSMTVMIQKEVAERITATPGAMSVLSVMTQYYSRPKYVFDVGRTNFWPAPNVDSAVVQCQIQSWPDPAQTKRFFRMVKAGFSSRRKQLHNSLGAGLGLSPDDTEKVLRQSGVLGSQRAQDLTLENWLTIAKNLN